MQQFVLVNAMRFPKQGKYNNQKVERDNRTFASKGEAGLYDFLRLREQNGEITDLECQVQVHLTAAKILYKPDYRFKVNGVFTWAEFKGFETNSWRIKRRLWIHYGPGILEIYKGQFPRISIHEVLIPTKKGAAGE